VGVRAVSASTADSRDATTASKKRIAWLLAMIGTSSSRVPKSDSDLPPFPGLAWATLREQPPNRIRIDRDVQIPRSDRDIRVPGRIANLGQCATPGQGVADECMPAVVNGQRFEPLQPKHFACRPKPLAKSMARKHLVLPSLPVHNPFTNFGARARIRKSLRANRLRSSSPIRWGPTEGNRLRTLESAG
jgi:hypothetical protein